MTTARDTWDKVRSIPRRLSGYMDRLPNALKPVEPINCTRRCKVMEVTTHYDHHTLHGVNGLEVMIATGLTTCIIKARDCEQPRVEYEIRSQDAGLIAIVEPGDEIEVSYENIVSATFHGFRP